MITKALWNNFNTLKHYTIYPSLFIDSCTPSELAFVFIIYVILTPFLIILDLIFIPIEVIYYILTRYYERKLENESN